MNYFQVILMAIVQGLSEFLPISSSGHLVFTSNIYKLVTGTNLEYNTQEVFTDIILHLGTLIAVLIFYRKELWEILKALFVGIKNRDFSSPNAKLGLYIILGTFVTIAIAYPLYGIAKHLVFSPFAVGVLLTFTGSVLIFSEYVSRNILEKQEQISLKTSIMIAIAQGIAALPGFSRSGLTISMGLIMGLDRNIAARYSFLLSIPIIIGASMVYPLIELDATQLGSFDWKLLSVGAIVSGLVGYICIKYFIKFISKFSLTAFGIYCIIVGFLMTALFYFVKG